VVLRWCGAFSAPGAGLATSSWQCVHGGAGPGAPLLQVASLEAERGKLVRALVREVGEEVPLAKLLDEGSDWKGRREQVIALRDKVKQLKSQLVGSAGQACCWLAGGAKRLEPPPVRRCLLDAQHTCSSMHATYALRMPCRPLLA
jgi:hypothetical protein